MELTDEEIEGALSLMESMSRDDLDDPEFRDTYTEAVQQIIEAKREGQELPQAPAPAEDSGGLVDLMAALNESVQKARASRGEDADVHEMKPRKKAAGKKSSARRPRRAS